MRRAAIYVVVFVSAYMLPFGFFSKAEAAATLCTSVPYQCLGEGAYPPILRAYGGQRTNSHSYSGVRGALSALSTTVNDPQWNGFAHWYGIVNKSLPSGYGEYEWMQVGFANGFYNYPNYPMNNDYNWYSESYTWCLNRQWTPAGGYTPDTTHLMEASMTFISTYSCGGGPTLYSASTYVNNSLVSTRFMLEPGSNYRVDANSEYLPWNWMNPINRVCFGSAWPSSSCVSSSWPVERTSSGSWSTWGSSSTTYMSDGGYNRNHQATNHRFNVTSVY